GESSTGLSDCKEVKDRSKKLVFARVKEIVECWYSGGKNCDSGAAFSRICNLLGGSLTPSEVDSNHVGQSCGEWSEVQTEYEEIKNSLGMTVGLNSESQVISSGGKGDRERAYVAGAYVSATECSMRRVFRMIDNGTLSLNACKALGTDVAALQKSFVGSVSHIGNGEGQVANRRELLDKCDFRAQKVVSEKYTQQQLQESDAQAERLDQKNCRLVTQRSGIEAMFQQLAVCEIMAQVDAAYNRFVMGSMSPGVMQGRIEGWVQDCKKCGPFRDKCHNECYRKNFLDYIRGQIGQSFGSCG
ncbi:hypothetical protein EBZ37_13905, partial [bacterium]|nr:hypothetical protein [bacterium]